MTVEQFTDEQLETKLVEVLQTWPLYRKLEYTCAEEKVAVPKRISLFCPYCKLDTSWETYNATTEYNRFTIRQYDCKNCDQLNATYYFWWGRTNTKVFFKVGQYPEMEERVSESLEDALNAEDLKTYKNALRTRNFNFGIGAVAYMRRVIENRMNDILEVLHEAALVHYVPPELVERHEEMKKERRFSVKVDYAGDLLSPNLRPEGQPNPIGILHELASEGLHAKSDEECVDIFDACRTTFEYVFGKMRIETKEAKNFVKEMAVLAEKKTKSAKTKPTPD